MKKTKLLEFTVIALFILNFGILGFLFLHKDNDGPRDRKMPREIVIEKLHFNKNQVEKYDNVIRKHRQNIRIIDDSIRKTRNELYQLLNFKTVDTLKRDILYLKFSSFQKQIETTHFNHFIEIKNICKENQLQDFDNLTKELSKIFSNGKKPHNE